MNFNGPTVNAGFVGLLNPGNNQLTVIASGGTRGDYVSTDVTNGTLLLVCSDVIYRLSCGPNCAIGQPITPTEGSVPEPSGTMLAGPVLMLIAIARRILVR